MPLAFPDTRATVALRAGKLPVNRSRVERRRHHSSDADAKVSVSPPPRALSQPAPGFAKHNNAVGKMPRAVVPPAFSLQYSRSNTKVRPPCGHMLQLMFAHDISSAAVVKFPGKIYPHCRKSQFDRDIRHHARPPVRACPPPGTEFVSEFRCGMRQSVHVVIRVAGLS